MGRIWRQGTAELIVAFLLLDVIEYLGRLYRGGSDAQLGKLAAWYCLTVLLAWGIWRASKLAWVMLVVLTELALVEALLGLFRPGAGLFAAGLLSAVLVQFVLLLSPAIRRRRPVQARRG